MGVVLPQSLDQVEVCEFVKFHKGVQDLDVKFIPAGDKTRVWFVGQIFKDLLIHFNYWLVAAILTKIHQSLRDVRLVILLSNILGNVVEALCSLFLNDKVRLEFCQFL